MSIRISILTPSFNQGAYIEETIQSVLTQAYPDYEHIVVDGGSSDDTISVLRAYPHVKWISEPDRGQSDALNKALALANGTVIGWLNADDYYEPHIFGRLDELFADPEVLWAVGNLTTVSMDGHLESSPSPEITYDALLRDPDIVRQPCTFFRREVLDRAEGWDPSLHMAMDYDLWIRIAKRYRPIMVQANWAYFRIHPGQKTSRHSIRRQCREINAVLGREQAPGQYRLRILARKHCELLRGYTKAGLVRLGLLAA